MPRALFQLSSISLAILIGSSLGEGSPITASGSLGTVVTNPSGQVYNITGGTLMPGSGGNNGNLFHSFGAFSVPTNGVADFIVPTNTVANIIARVTGGTASTIDGQITSTVGSTATLSSANLFLLNPAGIMFTSGASVNLGGSFVASTADSVTLNDGTIFYSSLGHASDTSLTASPVASFGFLHSNTGTISANGATLSAPELQFLVGPGSGTSGVTLTSSSLTATSGAVGLFAGTAASGGGTVKYSSGNSLTYSGSGVTTGFNFTGTSSGVALTSGSSVSSTSSGANGGHVVIRGGVLTVDNTSTITSANTGAATGGGISLQADTLTLNGAVSSTASGSATGGDIALAATTQTTIQNNDSANSGEGSVTSQTSGTGTGGGITINSGTLTLTGAGSVVSTSTTGTGAGSGDAGALTINSAMTPGAVSLAAGTQILSFTSGAGNAGALSLNTTTLAVTGSNGTSTGIFSQSNSGAHGAAGRVNVSTTDALTLSGSGAIESQSDGAGGATGGAVTITSAGALSLDSGGQIVTETSGNQNAAALSVTANAADAMSVDSLTIDGTGGSSGIFSKSNNGATGTPGTLNVDSGGTVALANGGSISSPGGAITLGANALTNLTVSASSRILDTGTGPEVLSINATGTVTDSGTISTASAGGIAIDSAASVALSGGTISSSRGAINLGSNSPIGGLSLSNSGAISQTGNGAINITSTGTVSIAGSTLSTTGPGTIAIDKASTVSLTGGGSITSALGDIDLGSNTAIGALSVTGGSSISQNGTHAINVSGTGTITVSGTGSAIEANHGGSLNVGTSSSAKPAISVASGGTLSTTTGGLTVNAASGTVSLTSGGTIESVTTGGSNAGDVSVTAGGINITGSGTNSTETSSLFTLSNTGIFSLSEDSASGNAGNLTVKTTSTTGNITLSTGGQIASATTNNSTGDASAVEILMNGGVLTVGGFTANASSPSAMIYSTASSLTGEGGFVTIQPTGATLPSVILQNGASIQTATHDGFAGIIYLDVSDLSVYQNASIESDVVSSDSSSLGTAGLVFVSVNGGLNVAGDIQAYANAPSKPSSYDPFFFDPVFVEVGGGFKDGGTFTSGQYTGGTLQTSNGGGYTPDNYIRINVNGNINPATGYTLPFILSQVGSGTPGYGLILDGSTGTFLPTANSVLGTVPTVTNPIIPTPIYVVYNDEGTNIGSNLYISFKQFDLDAAETVIFDAQQTSTLAAVGNTVQNILIRVTNGSPSIINGEIEEYSSHLATQIGINNTGADTTANLIFINPNGITFERNGSVSLFNNAALTLSTADYLGFSANDADATQRFYTGTTAFDGTTIDGAGATAGSGLGTVAPYAFGFLPGGNFSASNQIGSKSVAFDGSKANFSNGNTGELSIIAGDIFMGQKSFGGTATDVSGTVLAATNNQILLFSAGSPGVLTFTQADLTTPASSLVGFSPDPSTALQQIAFSGTTLGSIGFFDQSVLHVLGGDSAAGSAIVIRADTFSLNNSFVLDEAQADQANASLVGGSVVIDANTSIGITSSGISSYISTSNYGFGTGGSIEIITPTLSITGDGSTSDQTGIFSAAQPILEYANSSSGIVSLQAFQYDASATGDGMATQNGTAGNITLNLSGSLTLNGGTISAATTGKGVAGTINVLGSDGFNPQVLVSNGGIITSSTSLANPYFSQTGNAGSINLRASLLSVDGSQSSIQTSAGSPSNANDTASAAVGTLGNGVGTIAIDIVGASSTSPSMLPNNTISITGGGQISASTYTAGLGGTIAIGANNAPVSVTIDGSGSGILAGEFGDGSSSGLSSGTPAISVTTTGALTLTYGGQINTSASGLGSAGNITVSSATLSISGVNVNGDAVATSNRTGILSEATGAGNGGKIMVHSGALTIDGAGLAHPQFTGISADAGTPTNAATDATGDGGNVSVIISGNNAVTGETGDIAILSGGQISASSFTSGYCGFVEVIQSNSSDGHALTINGDFNGVAEQQATGILADCFGAGGINPHNPTDAALNPMHPSPLAVSVTADGNVSVTAGGEISSATFDEAAPAASGNGGALALVISSGGLTIDGTGTPEVFGQAVSSFQTAVLSTGVLSTTYGAGRAGNLTADITGPVSISGGGAISDGSIFGSGNGGDLDVKITGALSINGAGAPILILDSLGGLDYVPTGIVTSSYFGPGETGAGNAGNLTVSATGTVTILAGGQISSGSIIGGQGGVLNVTTGALTINGANTPANPTVLLIPTGILSSSIEGGDAGQVTVTANGAVSLTNGGQISSQTTYGGSGNTLTLTITSGALSINGSNTQVDGSGNAEFSTGVLTSSVNAGDAGDLNVTVTNGDVSVTGGGQLSSETNAGGNGGQLTLTVASGSLTINGSGAPAADVEPVFTYISSPTPLQTGLISSTSGSGDAGNATLTISGGVDITAGGLITSATSSDGAGGTVYLSASSLTIDGSQATAVGTGISTSSMDQATNAGSGGDVNLSISGAIAITGGGQVSATTEGGDGVTTGNGGNIYIGVTSLSANLTPSQQHLNTPTSLTISGSGAGGTKSAITSATTGVGSAGNINAKVSGTVAMAGGGQISTGTTDVGSGSGSGGTITLTSASLTIDGTGATAGSTGIFSTSTLQAGVTPGMNEPNGDAGVVNLTANGPVSLTAGGRISSSTTSNGAAGTVAVSASSLVLDASEIATSSSGPPTAVTALGDTVGTISLSVPGSITISDGAQVTATTSTGQNGGSVNILQPSSPGVINASGNLSLSGGGSAITAAATGTGDGGDVRITTDGALSITDNATITCSSEASNAGNMTINANELILERGGSIDTTANAVVTSPGDPEGNGGNIMIKVGNLVYLFNSDILTKATNTGGNITIDPEFVVLDSSLISAAGGFGDGNISIATTYLLSGNSTIIATGTVSLNTVPLDLSGSLIALPGELADEEKRLRESCARSVNHEFSSLIVVGRGGTESAPEELQPDFGIDALPQPRGAPSKSVQ